MKKVTTLVLMLCFILSGALCYAHGEARTENEKGEGIPIEVKECTGVSGSDRSNSINALGVTVMTDELNGNQGQKVLDLRDLSDGVYVYTISCGEYVQTGKLVIAK